MTQDAVSGAVRNNPVIRVLFLTKYCRQGASSRYRSFQYLPMLSEAGFDCTVEPLFDDAYLAELYDTRRVSRGRVLARLLRRLTVVAAARRFDLVFLEKEILPYFLTLPERWLGLINLPYVADYDDALHHQYDQHGSWWVRRLLGNKIATVMRHATVVTAGNAYLADYARRVGAGWVEVIPTVIDVSRYSFGPSLLQSKRPLIVGWIGSPSTTRYLEAIGPALAEVCRTHDVQVRLIGAGPVELPEVPLERLPWIEAEEVAQLKRFDIGIMPLPDEPWERGKCGFKLIQYMACGLPVLASPVGVNCEIVEPGVNGFLADSVSQWIEALNTLLDDADLRQRLGAAGRCKVERQYSIQVTGPRLAEILRSAVGGR